MQAIGVVLPQAFCLPGICFLAYNSMSLVVSVTLVLVHRVVGSPDPTCGTYISLALFPCSCQTYEGGFSAVPGSEAHGGYAFCGFAAALLLNKQHLCDTQKLLVSVTATHYTLTIISLCVCISHQVSPRIS